MIDFSLQTIVDGTRITVGDPIQFGTGTGDIGSFAAINNNSVIATISAGENPPINFYDLKTGKLLTTTFPSYPEQTTQIIPKFGNVNGVFYYFWTTGHNLPFPSYFNKLNNFTVNRITITDIDSTNFGNRFYEGRLNIALYAAGIYRYLDVTGQQITESMPNSHYGYSYIGNSWYIIYSGTTIIGVYNRKFDYEYILPAANQSPNVDKILYGSGVMLISGDIFIVNINSVKQYSVEGLEIKAASGNFSSAFTVTGCLKTNGLIAIMIVTLTSNQLSYFCAMMVDGENAFFGYAFENPFYGLYYNAGNVILNFNSTNAAAYASTLEIVYPTYILGEVLPVRNYCHNYSRGVPVNFGGNLSLPATYNVRKRF